MTFLDYSQEHTLIFYSGTIYAWKALQLLKQDSVTDTQNLQCVPLFALWLWKDVRRRYEQFPPHLQTLAENYKISWPFCLPLGQAEIDECKLLLCAQTGPGRGKEKKTI